MAEEHPQLSRLRTRVEAWYQAVKDGRYDNIYKMRLRSDKQGDQEKRNLERLLKEANRSIRLSSWEIAEIKTQGNVAQVRVLMKVRVREDGGWIDTDDEQVSYWTYQSTDWFALPGKPETWVQ